MLSLDILEIAGFSFSSCHLNQESPYPIALTIIFHLAAALIMVPYFVAMIRHSSGTKVRSWLGRKAG